MFGRSGIIAHPQTGGVERHDENVWLRVSYRKLTVTALVGKPSTRADLGGKMKSQDQRRAAGCILGRAEESKKEIPA